MNSQGLATRRDERTVAVAWNTADTNVATPARTCSQLSSTSRTSAEHEHARRVRPRLSPCGRAYAEDARYGRHDERVIGDIGELDGTSYVGEAVTDSGRACEHDMGLAAATGTYECEQPATGLADPARRRPHRSRPRATSGVTGKAGTSSGRGVTARRIEIGLDTIEHATASSSSASSTIRVADRQVGPLPAGPACSR